MSLFTELPRGLVVLGMRVSGIPSSRKPAQPRSYSTRISLRILPPPLTGGPTPLGRGNRGLSLGIESIWYHIS